MSSPPSALRHFNVFDFTAPYTGIVGQQAMTAGAVNIKSAANDDDVNVLLRQILEATTGNLSKQEPDESSVKNNALVVNDVYPNLHDLNSNVENSFRSYESLFQAIDRSATLATFRDACEPLQVAPVSDHCTNTIQNAGIGKSNMAIQRVLSATPGKSQFSFLIGDEKNRSRNGETLTDMQAMSVLPPHRSDSVISQWPAETQPLQRSVNLVGSSLRVSFRSHDGRLNEGVSHPRKCERLAVSSANNTSSLSHVRTKEQRNSAQTNRAVAQQRVSVTSLGTAVADQADTSAGGQLRYSIESCFAQLRFIEQERKQIEIALNRPSVSKSQAQPNWRALLNVAALGSSQHAVNRLIQDSLREHKRVVDLLVEMERSLGGLQKLPASVHSAASKWLDNVRRLQTRRKETIMNDANRSASASRKVHDDRDALALSTSVIELGEQCQKVRTALWCAGQLSLAAK